jgi:hypothetical protein
VMDGSRRISVGVLGLEVEGSVLGFLSRVMNSLYVQGLVLGFLRGGRPGDGTLVGV